MLFPTALVALAATLVSAVPEMKIEGASFVDQTTGKKFEIVGMAYQPGGSSGFKGNGDPLSDPDTCLRDAALMQILGINAIRVYNLDPDANHDECASIFNAAGMYMLIDVNSPLVGQNLGDPTVPWESYYKGYLNHTFAVIEAFSGYPNTLLFFSGNENIQAMDSIKYVPQYLRAVTRDLKNYIKKNIARDIPVGYSAADVRPVLVDTWNYLTCAEDGEEDDISRSDLFAMNSYSWCGPAATFQSSTYDVLVSDFKDSSVPIFFSEYGCIQDPPRYWNDTQALYSDQMDGTFSGGVAYQWTQDANKYGIVQDNGDSVKLLDQYNILKDKLGLIDWKSIESLDPSKDHPVPPACKPSLIKTPGFNRNFTLIPPPPGVQDLIDNGIDKKPVGKFVNVNSFDVTQKVLDADGNEMKNLKVVKLGDDEFNWQGKNEVNTESSGGSSGSGSGDSNSKPDSDKDDAAGFLKPVVWAAALPLLAMIFA